MKNKKLLVLSSIVCLSLIAGCDGNKDNGNNNEETPVEVHIKELLSIDKRDTFLNYERVTTSTKNTLADYVVRTNKYVAGTENNFKLAPALTYLDLNDDFVHEYNHPEQWTAGWSLKLEEVGGTLIPDTKYTFDSVHCEVKLSEELVGKTIKSTVTPNANSEIEGGENASRSDAVQEFTFEVQKGYNIYNATELSYFDNRDESTGDDYGNGSGDCNELIIKQHEFKSSKGLNPDYHPELLLIHESLDVTTNDLSGQFFYKDSELANDQIETASNSWKDYTFFYQRIGDGNITLNGNYFKVSFEKIPLSVRHRGTDEIMGQGSAIAHSALFKVDGGSATIKNLTLIGNGPNAKKQGDEVNAGGDIAIKAGTQATSVTFDNVLAVSHCITCMSETVNEGLAPTNYTISNCKFSDNYNSFLYNWGGVMDISDSYMGGCGGPIIIQDQVGIPDAGPWESPSGDVWYGFPPKTTFKDCELINYVNGGEAWFQQFNATSLIPTIKGLNQIYEGFNKTFLAGLDAQSNLVPQKFGGLEGSSNQTFNFILLNKSSNAQAITTTPVCGEVKFVNTKETETHKEGTTTFNYLKADAPENYISHMSLRTLNANGAPVFETAGGQGGVLGQDENKIPIFGPLNSANSSLAPIYEFASYVYQALQIVNKESDDVKRTITILNDNAYLKETFVRLAALKQSVTDEALISANADAFFAGAIFELAKDQLRGAALADTGFSYNDLPDTGALSKETVDTGIMQMLMADQPADAEHPNATVLAETMIYPAIRPLVIIANMLKTGKVYTQELGLVDIVSIYKGIMGYGTDRETSISEAIIGYYSLQYFNNDTKKWAAYTPLDPVMPGLVDWSMAINISEIAFGFANDSTMSVARACSIANNMKGTTPSYEGFGDEATEYTAIYYNGMMLVLGLDDLPEEK